MVFLAQLAAWGGIALSIWPPRGRTAVTVVVVAFGLLSIAGFVIGLRLYDVAKAESKEGKQKLADIHLVVVDIQRRLGGFVGPVLVPVSASATASWEALTGVEATGGAGRVGVEITLSKKGIGEEEVEHIFLAAPLLDDKKKAALREALSKVSGNVSFIATEGTVKEMDDLAEVFRESKWNVVATRVAQFQEPIVDIIVQAASEDAAYAGFVQGVMMGLGIDAVGAILPNLPKDQIEIVVGNFTAKPATPSTSRRLEPRSGGV